MSNSNTQAPFRTGDVVYLISGGPAMTVVTDESQDDGSRTVTAAYFNAKDEFDVIEVLPAMLIHDVGEEERSGRFTHLRGLERAFEVAA
jgi:uncharacterized protein YodC (DUF2158 family)